MTDARNEFPTGVEGYTLRVDSANSIEVLFRGEAASYLYVTDNEDERSLVGRIMGAIEGHQHVRDIASNFTKIA